MKLWVILSIVIFTIIFALWGMMGAGGFKRMVTLTGVYAVCKPGGYGAVCFLDADSKQGGLSCIPFNGECTK